MVRLTYNRIAVAGATGTTGKELVKQLSETKRSVVALVRSKRKAEQLLNFPNVEYREVDFKDLASMKLALQGCQAFYSLNSPDLSFVEEGINQINAASASGVQYIIRLSGIGADRDDGITLQRWHHEVDVYLEKSGIAYTIIRPNSFMQKFLTFHVNSIKNENCFYIPVGDARISFIDIRDIVRCIVVMFNDPTNYLNKKITLTGKESLSNYDIANIFSLVLNREVNYISPPLDEAKNKIIALSKHESMPWRVEFFVEVCTETRKGKKDFINNEIEKITGREPITFYKFVEDHKTFFTSEA